MTTQYFINEHIWYKFSSHENRSGFGRASGITSYTLRFNCKSNNELNTCTVTSASNNYLKRIFTMIEKIGAVHLIKLYGGEGRKYPEVPRVKY